MITVEVRVDPPYPVRIGPGALHEAHRWLPDGRIALVADANVAPLHGEAATRTLRTDRKSTRLNSSHYS